MVDGRFAARFTAILVAAVALLALSTLPAAGTVEEEIGARVGTAAAALTRVARPVTDVLLRAGQLEQLGEENAVLRERVARLESSLAALRESQAIDEQRRALERSLGVDLGPAVEASVLLLDPAPGRRTAWVDRGARDGVAAGQAVIGAGSALVGVVVEVDQARARVRLLTDPRSAVAGLLQSSRTPVAVAGTGGGLALEFVEVDTAVAPGDVVVTSAIGGLLPGGLLIGRVSDVRSSPQQALQRVDVEPLADLPRLERVLVLTGFAPVIDGLGGDLP